MPSGARRRVAHGALARASSARRCATAVQPLKKCEPAGSSQTRGSALAGRKIARRHPGWRRTSGGRPSPSRFRRAPRCRRVFRTIQRKPERRTRAQRVRGHHVLFGSGGPAGNPSAPAKKSQGPRSVAKPGPCPAAPQVIRRRP